MPKTKQNKRIFFTIADENNLAYAEKLVNSFKHFHPNEEFFVVQGKQLADLLEQDPQFFYRATPSIAWNFFNQGYDEVIKIDADSVITGDLSHTWEGDFDIGVVNNSNPRELEKYPVNVWNIHPLSYVNAGYVVMKNPLFVQHWLGLCASPHFEFYQMREQDLLNIMVFYMGTNFGGTYKVNFLDAGEKAHGLVARSYELEFELVKDKLYLKPQKDWNQQKKQVVVWHAAGGNRPDKMNFDTQFEEPIAKWLKKLTTKTED